MEGSLQRLGLEYVDLCLIHWPLPHQDKFVKAWQAFEVLQRAGKVRAIGVSNFRPQDLDKLAEHSDTVPAVNQIELHPALQQRTLREYHRTHGIATETWSRSRAQMVLRWHLRRGNIVFPKSTTPKRIRANIDIFDFELDEPELAAIDGLDEGRRTRP